MLMTITPAFAESFNISLLPGDSNTKVTIEAVKALNNDYPEVKGRIKFQIYPLKDIKGKDLTTIKDSDLILINIHGRQLANAVKSELKAAIKAGATVYNTGPTYDEDHKTMGIVVDKKINEYFQAGGLGNIKNLLLYVLKKEAGVNVSFESPVTVPKFGIYDHKTKRIYGDFKGFKKEYSTLREGMPWIGVVFYKHAITVRQTQTVDAVIDRLETGGFNVLAVYGWPPEAVLERFFPESNGESRVKLIVGVGLKIGIKPDKIGPVLSKLNVPVISAVTLYSQSEEEWRRSKTGLDTFERAWQIAQPEMGGIIQPTVIATKEKVTDGETGIEYIEERPVDERIDRLVQRVRAWVNLQDKKNKDKRIAFIYYNYPPGKNNIGASYLNVLPESLWEMINRLKAEGYDLGEKPPTKEELFNDVFNYGRNIGNWAPGELDRVVKNGQAVLIPLSEYKDWFSGLPAALRNEIIRKWGYVEDSNIMIWTDRQSKKYIVIPSVRYGKILLTPQSLRGVGQDLSKLYHPHNKETLPGSSDGKSLNDAHVHDTTLPPHHQYMASYLYYKNGFKADALVHVGTHGTHEWLSGKEVGFTPEDPPEALIQDMPNIYPYIVDDVGEGIQAKRRGMAVIIDHMTPPFDRAGLNKELKDISGLINDYHVAKGKSRPLSEVKLKDINTLAKKTGVLKDLGYEEITTGAEVKELEIYIKEISEQQTPFGLHTFGRAPEKKYRRSTAEAVVSINKGLDKEERERQIAEFEDRMVKSAERELNSLTAALSGEYIPAGIGNDPIRNPGSLPTGKNFYSFDPTRIPSKGIYETGVKLGRELIESYRKKNKAYPDKLTFNLWAVETIRHEGVMESQIMYLMGIKPVWNARKAVIGVEPITRKELGRPRIDVVMVPSGLYRDMFSNLMGLLDDAVTMAREQDEEDNILRANTQAAKKELMEHGVAEKMAQRLATVRIFTEPSGAYGTGINTAIERSDSWEDEEKVTDVFFMRMSNLYGQGFWGKKISGNDIGIKNSGLDISLMLFKDRLSGSKMTVHSISTNLYGTLDNDDLYQYLGGTAMAIRSIDGKTPEVYVTNMSNPKMPKQETVAKFMGREMRTRYLNPKWIDKMMKEGYSGARMIDKIVEHLWGWQVTVPEAVDGAKWQEMYETYVLDKNGLEIKKMFKEANNLFAYQSLVARMLETVRKGYWTPDKDVIETLAKEYAETAQEEGLACNAQTCSNPLLSKYIKSVLISVPGMESQAREITKAEAYMKTNPGQAEGRRAGTTKTPREAQDRATGTPGQAEKKAADTKDKKPEAQGAPARKKTKTESVEGYEMEEVNKSGEPSAPIPFLFIAGVLVFIALIAIGWKKRK